MSNNYNGLTDKDIKDFGRAGLLIANLMLDGRWHTATTIIEAAEHREGLRSMRKLRERQGWFVEKRKFGGSREWLYKLVIV